jgi:hypothetical protein
MPYCIMRFAKKKMGGVGAAEKHDEREKEEYKSNPDIDLERRTQNYHLVEPTNTYRKMIEHRVLKNECKVRKNSTVMVETLITASPEFLSELPAEEQREYFSRAVKFIEDNVGKDNIMSAVVHMDERTPHMHLCFVPITPKKRLSAKDILGNQAKLSEWQTKFHTFMNARWPELERGISSMITGRKHLPVWLFKTAERLDKRFDEVSSALSDINAFNAGKKKEKALEVLEKWIPDAEKFTAQIKSVNSYIDILETNLSTETSINEKYRSQIFEGEEKLNEATKKIYSLQSMLERTKEMLERIPPEILEQFQNNRNNRLER